MNRTDLQQLALTRIEEARLLLDHGKYDGAYYLSGYAAECAIKACIAKTVKRYDFPDKKLAQNSWVHDLAQLLSVAELAEELKAAANANPEFDLNWTIVKDWNEGSRYRRYEEQKARDLFEALTHPQTGVLTWLKDRW